MIRRMALSLFALTLVPRVVASGVQPVSAAQGTPTVQLPLSGRNPQAGSVTATQSPVSGTTTSINTLNPSIQTQGPYGGSATAETLPFDGALSLRDAIERGLAYNLGPLGLNEIVRQARSQTQIARSALFPNIAATMTGAVQQTNLRAIGVRADIPVPGASFPTIAGPFNYVDFRLRLTQTFDLTARSNYRSAEETLRAEELSLEDAGDLTVLAVGGAYLQVQTAAARLDAVRAQLDTATALFEQTTERHDAGLVALIDVHRSEVQVLTQQQRIVTLENDLSKQKINLARLTGLPVNDQFELADEIAFSLPPPISLDEALAAAFRQRADVRSAEAQVRAAENSRAAARHERLPSLSVNADYGAIGVNPAQSHGTFSIIGTVRVPIFQGGRTDGAIARADAALAQRKSELSDIRGRIESEMRNAYLDLQAATSQIEVAQRNLEVNEETLELARQRFDAGVSDNLEVVRSQDAVAGAVLDYINSVFAHNVAKLALARAIGRAAEDWPKFVVVQ